MPQIVGVNLDVTIFDALDVTKIQGIAQSKFGDLAAPRPMRLTLCFCSALEKVHSASQNYLDPEKIGSNRILSRFRWDTLPLRSIALEQGKASWRTVLLHFVHALKMASNGVKLFSVLREVVSRAQVGEV